MRVYDVKISFVFLGMYFALDSKSLEESIKTSELADYRKMKYGRCTDGKEPPSFWLLQRGCCTKCYQYDALLPGVFKVRKNHIISKW